MSVSLEPVDVSESVEEPQISENIDTPVTPAEQLPDNVEPESKPIPAPEPKNVAGPGRNKTHHKNQRHLKLPPNELCE